MNVGNARNGDGNAGNQGGFCEKLCVYCFG